VVTTLAGLAGGSGTNDGTGSAALFNLPYGLAVDGASNLYVADSGNNTIRKVTPVGENWVVTTLAGSPGNSGTNDGTGTNALFNYPVGLAVDSASNLYVADYGNNTIRKVTPVGKNWVVTTLAGSPGNSGANDGTGTNALFNGPWDLAVDSASNLYVTDSGNNTIRKVTPAGAVTTLAGSAQFNPAGRLMYGSADGTGSAAQFNSPEGVAVDSTGNVYVVDGNNFTLRKVAPVGTNWVVTTLAGSVTCGSADGTGSAARFSLPHGVAVDSAGNLYVADSVNYTVRKVTPEGAVTTLAGLAGAFGSADGTGVAARFERPDGVEVDTNGNLYVTDYDANTIRKVTSAGEVTTLAGSAGNAGTNDGTGTNALFNGPWGLAVDSAGYAYVADSGNDTIRKVTPTGAVTTLAGSAGNPGSADGTGTNALFSSPRGLAVDSAGNLYVADYNNSTVRKVTPTGVVTTLAGSAGNFNYADGTGTNALFNGPAAVAVDGAGNAYVADFGTCIRKVTPAGVVTTLAGLGSTNGSINGVADGTGSAAHFNVPFGVAVDRSLNVYLADTWNNSIRKGFPASSVPPPLLRQVSLSAGQFGFGITGVTNLAMDIESSPDLSDWQVVSTLVLEGGSNSFATPNPSQDAQFYRGHVR
jgi:sugar lactone lactonase YvrE